MSNANTFVPIARPRNNFNTANNSPALEPEFDAPKESKKHRRFLGLSGSDVLIVILTLLLMYAVYKIYHSCKDSVWQPTPGPKPTSTSNPATISPVMTTRPPVTVTPQAGIQMVNNPYYNPEAVIDTSSDCDECGVDMPLPTGIAYKGRTYNRQGQSYEY